MINHVGFYCSELFWITISQWYIRLVCSWSWTNVKLITTYSMINIDKPLISQSSICMRRDQTSGSHIAFYSLRHIFNHRTSHDPLMSRFRHGLVGSFLIFCWLSHCYSNLARAAFNPKPWVGLSSDHYHPKSKTKKTNIILYNIANRYTLTYYCNTLYRFI